MTQYVFDKNGKMAVFSPYHGLRGRYKEEINAKLFTLFYMDRYSIDLASMVLSSVRYCFFMANKTTANNKSIAILTVSARRFVV
jgi:hypothetical protein